jgi:hypothetical protein
VKLFACDNCDHVLFFENNRCMNCGQAVAYAPEAGKLVSLREPTSGDTPGLFEIAIGKVQKKFRRCQNSLEGDACNWLVAADGDAQFCDSCRLTEVIPDLSDPLNRQAWIEIESAKRRLVYTLFALKLPLASKLDDPDAGLAFRFLRSTPEANVMTGHSGGVVTLNVAEAETAFRENMREKMGEAYRTVLGHLRHEIGHYYWDRLIKDSVSIEDFRAQFGDERTDYQASITRHYEQGPPTNWLESYISAYATMHPWEDWAETWAHYMHMVDTLETAKSHGLTVRVPGEHGGAKVSTDALAFKDFESLIGGWHAVTLALNSLSRSMGMKDVYPFVLSPKVQEKLRFVHQVITRPRASDAPPKSKAKPSKTAPPSKRQARAL